MWDSRLHFDTKAAAEAADSLISLYPDEKEAYLFRGNLFEMNKNFDGAIRSYQKAVDLDTGYALAVMSLGYAYSAVNEQEKAVSQMQRYIRLAPEAADPLASYADLLVRAGRYEEALGQYRKSLQLKPDYWYSVREIGRVYATMGRLREAGEQFHRAAQLLPRSRQMEASILAADAYLDFHRGKYEDAIRQYTEALRMDTVNDDAAFGMVYALGKLRRFGEAMQTVEGITREFERRHLSGSVAMLGFHLMRARLLTEEDSLAEARAACRQALDFSTALTRGVVYQQFARIHLKEKALEPALDDCEEALRINPNAPETLLTLTEIYRDKGDLRMTREIGGRLLELWKHADADFVELSILKHLLSPKGAT
jgi:tetratricopeptide (TPR) repeat protein